MRTYGATPRRVCPERVSIEDTCLTAALPCPPKRARMAHRWPRDFALRRGASIYERIKGEQAVAGMLMSYRGFVKRKPR
jgi:hypothetical protein